MRLTLAFCRAKPNWMPKKPKHMFQICQNVSCGFAVMLRPWWVGDGQGAGQCLALHPSIAMARELRGKPHGSHGSALRHRRCKRIHRGRADAAASRVRAGIVAPVMRT